LRLQVFTVGGKSTRISIPKQCWRPYYQRDFPANLFPQQTKSLLRPLLLLKEALLLDILDQRNSRTCFYYASLRDRFYRLTLSEKNALLRVLAHFGCPDRMRLFVRFFIEYIGEADDASFLTKYYLVWTFFQDPHVLNRWTAALLPDLDQYLDLCREKTEKGRLLTCRHLVEVGKRECKNIFP
jgi:hypothetical protein